MPFSGNTPLMHTSELSVIKCLVEHKANVDAKNNDGNEIFRHQGHSLRFLDPLSTAVAFRAMYFLHLLHHLVTVVTIVNHSDVSQCCDRVRSDRVSSLHSRFACSNKQICSSLK